MSGFRLPQVLVGLIFTTLLAYAGYSYAQIPWRPVFAGISVAIVLALLLIAWVLLRRHPGRPDSRWCLPAAVLAGMALTGPMGPVNSAFQEAAASLPSVVFYAISPFPEETAKLLLVLAAVSAFAPVSRRIEVAVVGMAVGAGFFIAETMSFAAIAAATDLESDFADGTLTYAVRLIMSPFAHALYTGLAAWGLGALLCRTDRSLSWRLQRVASWFLLAVCVHGAFNASSELPGAAGLIAMLVTVAASWCLLVWCYQRSRAVGADAATESHTSR